MVQYPTTRLTALAAVLMCFSLAAACGSDDDGSDGEATDGADDTSGAVMISGSSTVESISVKVAEMFESVVPDVLVNVDGPGTGDGFKLFCAGETDISNASRQIKSEELEDCSAEGIDNIIELKVGIDGIAVITHEENTAVDCLTFQQLFNLIGPNAENVQTWAEASPDLPDVPLDLVGPGAESGTYDSFVEIVIEGLAAEAGVEATTRPDYLSSADDNTILLNVSGSPSSLGWVGFAYALHATDVKLLPIDGGTGNGCVEPTPESIASNEYPISRDLYIYINGDRATDNPAVAAYVDYYVSEGLSQAVSEVGYVALTEDAQAETREIWRTRTTAS